MKLRSQSGFTLIELLVVAIIIGILAALAIPNYFFARTNSLNATAASDMRNLANAADFASSNPPPDLAYVVNLDGTGGPINATLLPGGAASDGILGAVEVGILEYSVRTWHPSGSLCFYYDSAGNYGAFPAEHADCPI